jgi:streptogramin lyase
MGGIRARALGAALALTAAGLGVATATASPAAAANGDLTTYAVPLAGDGEDAQPYGIATAPDGSLWFTQTVDAPVGRVALDGTVSVLPGEPTEETLTVAAVPDGDIWVGYYFGDLGQFDPDTGALVRRVDLDGRAYALAVGSDGRLWWNDYNGYFGSLDPHADDPASTIRTYVDPDGEIDTLQGLTSGPDGRLWFSQDDGTIGSIDPAAEDPAATITTYWDPANDPDGRPYHVYDLVSGPDGRLWFTASDGKLRSLDPAHPEDTITTHAADVAAGQAIIVGPGEDIWVSIYNGVARYDIDTDTSTTYSDPEEVTSVADLSVGGDGAVWFTSRFTKRIGRVEVDSTDPTVTLTTPAEDAEYTQGEEVVADFSCDDESELSSCVGDLEDGAAVDTSTLGEASFTVTATDSAGNVTSVTHSYTVVDGTLPTVSISTPEQGATFVRGSDVVVDFICDDDVAVATCEGDLADGASLDTSTTGAFELSVTAIDTAGNTATATSEYTIVEAQCVGATATVNIAAGDRPTAGDDVIVGTPDDDVIDGRGGNDRICGRGGNDTLNGGGGRDQVYGAGGEDTVRSGPGGGRLSGGMDADHLVGGRDADTMTAGAGDDDLVAGAGNDRLLAGAGTDACTPAPGRDRVESCEVLR